VLSGPKICKHRKNVRVWYFKKNLCKLRFFWRRVSTKVMVNFFFTK